MIYTLDLNNVLDALYALCDQQSAGTNEQAPANTSSSTGHWTCPAIQRVTFNGDTTVVFFVDGTYCVMKCSAGDKYDRKTAVVYALAKRMLGKIGKTTKDGKFHANEVDGAGFGCFLQKIVDAGFDQQAEEKIAFERKRNAKTQHLERQAAEKKAAFDRRVEKRAKEILLERAAMDRANSIEDSQQYESIKYKSSKAVKNDLKTSYVRPDKPFSKFTQAEKREYWRWYNAKRRSKKNS